MKVGYFFCINQLLPRNSDSIQVPHAVVQISLLLPSKSASMLIPVLTEKIRNHNAASMKLTCGPLI